MLQAIYYFFNTERRKDDSLSFYSEVKLESLRRLFSITENPLVNFGMKIVLPSVTYHEVFKIKPTGVRITPYFMRYEI